MTTSVFSVADSAELLKREGDFTICGEADNALQAVDGASNA